MWKPGCNFDYIVGTCVHVELEIFGAIFLVSLLCQLFVLGLLGPMQWRAKDFATFNNSAEFLQNNSPICALNLELLYGSNSYHYHHHNGNEICFVLLSNIGKHEICLWSEIIWTREVKLKEMLYQVFSLRHCHKISMPRCSIPWVFILYAEEEETRPVTTQNI